MTNQSEAPERNGEFHFSRKGLGCYLAYALGFIPVGAGLAIHGARVLHFIEPVLPKNTMSAELAKGEIVVGTGMIFLPWALMLLSLRFGKTRIEPSDSPDQPLIEPPE